MTTTNVIGAFSEEHAARITHISRNQLREWDRAGFFKPSYGTPDRRLAYSRIYSFRDLVSLRVLNDLRNDKKIPLRHLREVSERLAHLGDDRWTKTTLYVLGKRVVLNREDVVSGQRVLDIPLRVVISATRDLVTAMNVRPASEIGRIGQSRFVSENRPVFIGTRVLVSAVREYLAAGYSSERIIQEYPGLTPDDVDAAMAYQSEQAAA